MPLRAPSELSKGAYDVLNSIWHIGMIPKFNKLALALASVILGINGTRVIEAGGTALSLKHNFRGPKLEQGSL